MGEQFDRRWIILAGFAAVAVIVVLAIVLTRGDDGDSGGGGETTAASKEKGDAACTEVEAPEPKDVSFTKPDEVLSKGEKATAVVNTNCGSFEIALDTTEAPKTANSFAFLAEEGFYDELTFHRIVPGFVIQGGDPEGTGTGGPGYSVDEKPPADLAYTKGVVAMAKSEAEPPGRSGSQFYVVTGADAGLPPEYALVGKVSEGLDVVEKIGELGGPDEKPTQTVLIESVEIEKE